MSVVLAAAPAAGGAGDAALPAEECVRLLRGARIARMREDATGELAKLRAAFERCPGEIAPIYGLVSYYRERPEDKASFQEFLALLLQRLRDPETELPVGVIEYLAGNPNAQDDELRLILDRIAKMAAGSPEPSSRLLRILFQLERRLGRDEAAVETLERLRTRDPAEDLLWHLIRLYFELGRWQDAARLIAPQVERDPVLRLRYMDVLGKLGRHDELMRQIQILVSGDAAGETTQPVAGEAGSREYLAGVTRFPGLFDLLKQVAWDLRDQGQDGEAEQIFRSLLRQVPDNAELQATVLYLYASDEERRGRAESLEQSWEAQTDPNALFQEGTQRLTAGDAAGAIDLLRRAAPEFPDLEAAWYNLGMAAYRLEDWATVDSAFRHAGEIQPERAQSFFYRGIALEKLGRCGEAVGTLERAAELDPERALAHYYLASCYGKLGDRAAAAAALERYQAAQRN